MKSLLVRFGAYKDGITSLIAVVLLVVGAYQYFEIRGETRIEKSLQMLKQREQSVFVSARTYVLKKWAELPELEKAFAETETYTPDLIKRVTTEIHSDGKYRAHLFDISTYYNNVAACALDGICDLPTLCASLAGEIQDYLDINSGYFAYFAALREEDARALFLSFPEFVERCKSKARLFVAYRHDTSFSCRFNLFLYRRFGFGSNDACRFKATKYDEEITKAAEEIKKLLGDSN